MLCSVVIGYHHFQSASR